MTRVDAVLCPGEIAALRSADLDETVCVVFDVLRATSTIVTALANGVQAVYPARDIEEAQALKEKFPAALLGGERRGERIAGFDLGNSPMEYRDLAGREVITTTTNGTHALRACEHARTVMPGSLLNVDAIAAILREEPPEKLLLVCAGTGNAFSMEDALGAGALVRRLFLTSLKLTDAALATLNLYEWRAGDLRSALHESKNGCALRGIAKGPDIDWCARVALYPTVAYLRDGAIRPELPAPPKPET